MIAVIADDLTGAAELGGIGLRYGLTVELVTDVSFSPAADLLIVAANTRSLLREDAEKIMADITFRLRDSIPGLIIYKKLDSVLRGHVVPEIVSHLKEMKLKRALVIPCNPLLGRVIRDGVYYINNEPIHETHFSSDPDFPVKGSKISDLLKSTEHQIIVKKHREVLPGTGIIVGEATDISELNDWAKKANADTLLCGAAGFFTALLEREYGPSAKVSHPGIKIKNERVYVCGSAYAVSVGLVKKAGDLFGSVSYMPHEIVTHEAPGECIFTKWYNEIIALYEDKKTVVIAIDPATVTGNLSPAELAIRMASVVRRVFGYLPVKELVIEGGATASAVLGELGINRVRPVQELAPGVVRSLVIDKENLHITVKPGSYQWPPGIWPF